MMVSTISTEMPPAAEWLHAFVSDAQVVAGALAYTNTPEALDIVSRFAARVPNPRTLADELLLERVLQRFLDGLVSRIAPRDAAEVRVEGAGAPHADESLRVRFVRQVERLGASARRDADNRYVAKFHATLDTVYATPRLRARDVAGFLNVSVSHLAHVLKACTGRGFAWHLRMRRMSAAAEHLRARTYSIKEIAALVGYSSVGQFDRRFRQTFEVTPSQFRARARGAAGPAGWRGRLADRSTELERRGQ